MKKGFERLHQETERTRNHSRLRKNTDEIAPCGWMKLRSCMDG
jgi:hypothetical protein